MEGRGALSYNPRNKTMTQLLIHRAYEKNLQIRPETKHWIFDQVVFFVSAGSLDLEEDVEYIADCSYSQGDAKELYVSHAESWINVSMLELDDQAAAAIRHALGDACDELDLEDILCGHEESVVDDVEDGGWHLQRIRAQVARRMGYDACVDWDEQGEVWMIDFAERNDEFNARWNYLGEWEELLP